MSIVNLISKYKPYPEYKDSGVEWLGELPEAWQVKRLGQYLFERREKCSDKEYLPLSVTKNGIVPQLDTAAKSDAGDNRKLVRKDDFVINSRSDRKGSSGISNLDGSVSLISIVLELRSIEPQFVHHLLRSYPFQEEFYRFGKGIVADLWSTNYSEMKNINIPIPNIEEQLTIAAFLDYETARIDQLIAKQQQLIELLKEKRQAVISHAVTKGLNPNVPMKDSGVEWLGQVPEHWVVSRIKNYAKIESGHTPSRQVEAYWENCTIPWVSLNDSKTLKEVDYISDTYYQISELGMANSSAHLLPEKAVLFTRDASIGLSAITTKPMAVSQHLIAWICKEEKVIPEYLLLVFYAMEKEFERYTFGATIKTIGMDDVRSLTAAFPDIDEQKKLISWAFTKLEKLKSALQKAESTIALLQERRTALISAAVTGKIDLRGWLPPKREEAA